MNYSETKTGKTPLVMAESVVCDARFGVMDGLKLSRHSGKNTVSLRSTEKAARRMMQHSYSLREIRIYGFTEVAAEPSASLF